MYASVELVSRLCTIFQETLATWLDWRNNEDDLEPADNRTSGSVCGQDPRSVLNTLHLQGRGSWGVEGS